MLRGDDAYLLSAMAQYGYSLLQPDRMADPNELLAGLAASADTRVLEGFPVVLANALEKHGQRVNLDAALGSVTDEKARERLRRLTALSFFLFDSFGYDELRMKAGRPRLVDEGLLAEVRDSMARGRVALEDGKSLDPGRIKRTFLNYFVQARRAEDAQSKASLLEDFQREYNLSLFFAPRQRDLLKKKLRGEALTKTEREYFSRVVKKKLLALADPDVQRLALKALR